MTNFFSGTSNLVLPVKNKSFFPPAFRDKTRLTYYASVFNSIEINASFYRMPVAKTVAKWSAEVGDDFRFTFKLIKDVTHCGACQFNLAPVARFMENISVTEKRGCLLVQLPPKFGLDMLQLELLIHSLTVFDWPIAIEFRHPSWYNETVFERLEAANIAMVLHDLKASATPLIPTSANVYLRFHGPEGGYRGNYADDFLYEYASYINDWINEGKTVYTYFNNTMGAAVQNLQMLNRFCRQLIS